jgi:hypothetical protein
MSTLAKLNNECVQFVQEVYAGATLTDTVGIRLFRRASDAFLLLDGYLIGLPPDQITKALNDFDRIAWQLPAWVKPEEWWTSELRY